MRVYRIFAASYLYPSDSTRQGPTRARMRGLRHKSRHKFLSRRKACLGFLCHSFRAPGPCPRVCGSCAYAEWGIQNIQKFRRKQSRDNVWRPPHGETQAFGLLVA